MRSSRILPLFAAIASLAIITVAGFGDAVEVTLPDDEVHAARFHDGVLHAEARRVLGARVRA
jgi:hypothetical protein